MIGITKKVEEELKEYEVKYTDAKKEKKKGRARGGILIAIKKNILEEAMQWLETNSSELLAFKIKIGKEDFLFANVYMREERNKNYEKMALYNIQMNSKRVA